MFSVQCRVRFAGSLAAASLLLLLSSPETWAAGPSPSSPLPVTVTNPADIAKAEGVQHPYQASVACGFPDNTCTGSINTPNNQRLILEYVSGFCEWNAN